MWSIQHSRDSQSPLPALDAIHDSLLHPQQRDIYVGLRMTNAVEARWQGNLQELKVGMLIATLVDDNELGHRF